MTERRATFRRFDECTEEDMGIVIANVTEFANGEIRRDSLWGARALLERFATRSVAGEVME
tara:strand:- start:184 stop:366 length:183 start_codon:yes stop_codon:yes gene_type:complete